MNIHLKYGKHGLSVELPSERVTIIEPNFVTGLPDERQAFAAALRQPVGTAPLAALIPRNATVAIAFCDVTRPVPNARIIPWLLEELASHPKEKITLINATGSHRPNTRAELAQMLTPAVVDDYRVINHNAGDPEQLTALGRSSFGGEIFVNSHYYAADVKILTGLIEPHLMAGFAGGPKMVLPGLAGLKSILHNHGAAMQKAPAAQWGMTTGNPLWEEMLEVAKMTKPTFIVNVTINKDHAMTGVFAGELESAHVQGVEFVRKTAMQPVAGAFDIVITTNAGYPLDLTLMQSMKGIAAASQIVRQGGSIVAAAECSEGIPDQSTYLSLLQAAPCIRDVLRRLAASSETRLEQWVVQIQAKIQQRADVFVYSSLAADDVRRCHVTPVQNIERCVHELLKKYGPEASIAVLPEGPQTIPYLPDRV